MRYKIIDYFLGDPADIDLKDELLFYAIMLMPIVITIIAFILIGGIYK